MGAGLTPHPIDLNAQLQTLSNLNLHLLIAVILERVLETLSQVSQELLFTAAPTTLAHETAACGVM